MTKNDLLHPVYWGIDSCRKGWFAVSVDPFRFAILRDSHDLQQLFDHAASVWIDIPIGLAEKQHRQCDILLRNALGKKAASVFQTPVRSAVYANDYRHACEINEKITGKRISRQAWNIVPKIRQVDHLLTGRTGLIPKVHECHPEWQYVRFLGDYISTSKKSQEGYEQRLKILENLLPGMSQFMSSIIANLPGQYVAPDDILDATVLAIAACKASENSVIQGFPEQPEIDEAGIPMQVCYV